MNRRKIEASGEDFHQLFAVVGDAAARATKCEAWANNYGKADLAGKLDAIFQIIDERRFRNVEADALHRIFEKQAVFSLLDGADLRADEDHVVLFEHAAVGQFNREVESGLAAYGWKYGKTSAGRHFALHANNLFEIFARERLDVSAIGRLGIGHDSGWIRVGEHDFKALGLEGLASLSARVVELGVLADDDGAGAEDQDFRDVSSSRQSVLLLYLERAVDGPNFDI